MGGAEKLSTTSVDRTSCWVTCGTADSATALCNSAVADDVQVNGLQQSSISPQGQSRGEVTEFVSFWPTTCSHGLAASAATAEPARGAERAHTWAKTSVAARKRIMSSFLLAPLLYPTS